MARQGRLLADHRSVHLAPVPMESLRVVRGPARDHAAELGAGPRLRLAPIDLDRTRVGEHQAEPPAVEQVRHGVVASFRGREVERGSTVIVGGIEIGALEHEPLHAAEVALASGPAEVQLEGALDVLPADARILLAVHAADGTEIVVMPDREVARAAIRQHDLEPVSVH